MRPPTLRHRIALASLVVVVVGCAGFGGPAPEPVDAVERHAYQAARSKLTTDPAAAEKDLAEFVAAYPGSPLAPNAMLRLGELARGRGDDDAGLAWFERVVTEHPRHRLVDIARVRIAQVQIDRDDAEAATQTLGRARLSRLPPPDRQVAYRILASAAPDPVAKLRWLARLRKAVETASGNTAFVDAELDELISQLDGFAIDRAIDQIGREVPGARLWIRRAQMSLDGGDIDGAERALKRSAGYPEAPGEQP